ncbi:MAG: hypothetical protein D6706_11320 [Chloroflexi bacterium]|nr:MAG: hypothetical protein D6706_11320 [Chloroflexota bacterium]
MKRSFRPFLIGCLMGVSLLLVACEFAWGRNVTPTTAVSRATLPDTPVIPSATPDPLLLPTGTAVPPLPTYTVSPALSATPAYNPALPDWTVLVYLDADNNLELAGLRDLNEMEAAGISERVNVLVQIDRAQGETAVAADWTETRRYRILPDTNPDQIASELLVTLGETNMGAPDTLADFITWGIQNYPANRYALILWDHGAGWNGIAFDNETTFPDNTDHMTLPELRTALAQATAATGLARFDVIGFDACLMGQLELFQTIQPFARYAVGSEELTPGQGWDYTTLLAHLYANPAQDGAQLARQMVADFLDYYTRVEPDDFVTMAAVDLTQIPAVTYAVEQLALILTADPAFVASAVGDARSGAEAFARVYADAFDRYAAVDLYHFASLLAQRAPNEAVRQQAQAVMTAVESAVLVFAHGTGFRYSQGLAIYFPRNGRFYNPAYTQMTPMPHWNTFLQQYHQTGLATLAPPEMHITNVLSDVVGIQQPAYLDIEIVGRDIENVVLLGGRYEADGRRKLVEYDNLIPDATHLPDGNQIFEWRDGVHDDFFVWYTDVTYLYDAFGNGDFVIMWPTDYGRSLFTVQGEYHRAGTTSGIKANLVFDHHTRQLVRIWGTQPTQNDAAAEIIPQPGDTFQIDNFYLDANNQIIREPGITVQFDDTPALYFEWRPLPDGNYFLGFRAENVAGETAEAFHDFTINNTNIQPDYATYLDPYLGFQFLYPKNWYRPVYTNTLLYTTDISNTTQLQITLYPDLPPDVDQTTLKKQTLNIFGPVDILFEDEIVIAGRRGLRTAYGYDKPGAGARTGIFLTFVHNNIGYVIDIDGPAHHEAQTIAAITKLIESWQFVPAGFGLQPGQWSRLNLDTFSIAQPTDFVYQPVKAWQRFVADQHTFVALRTEPATRSVTEVLAALLRDAAEGVTNFQMDATYHFPLAASVWQRADFSYQAQDGTEIWGFIMVKVEAGQEVVAWAEAPATVYNQLANDVFLVMLADLQLRP